MAIFKKQGKYNKNSGINQQNTITKKHRYEYILVKINRKW